MNLGVEVEIDGSIVQTDGEIFANRGVNEGTIRVDRGTFEVDRQFTNARLFEVGILGDFSVGTRYTQSEGETIVNGTLRGGSEGIHIDGGVIGGVGSIIGEVFVAPGAEAGPGISPGTLFVDGGFHLDPGGVIAMEVAGTASGEFDRLVVSGALDLLGDVVFELVGSMTLDLLETMTMGDFFLSGPSVADAAAIDPAVLGGASFFAVDGPSTYQYLLSVEGGLTERTLIDSTEVPEPRTPWLLAAGLAALGGATRCRRISNGMVDG